jgi:nitroreductase
MELKDALLKRRSIRKFKNEKVEDSLIDELLHAAMSGPSACNRQPWEFYVIKSEEKLNEIKKAMRFAKYNAPLAIIVCGNTSRALPLHLSQYWIQDCSAAIENILLRATDLGLGAVWCGIHPQKKTEKKIKEILKCGYNEIPLDLVLLGYPEEEPEARDQYNPKRVHNI